MFSGAAATGEAQVYRWESLQPGNRVEGCAVLEGVNTTYFIPDGWAMTIDPYGNGKVTAGLKSATRSITRRKRELTMSPERKQNRLRVTEYLDLDLDREQWHVQSLWARASARRGKITRRAASFTIATRAKSIRRLFPGAFNFSPDPLWVRIVEFYCPGCGTQVETEYLPPGHPITHDIEIDVEQLKERLRNGEFVIRGQRLEVVE